MKTLVVAGARPNFLKVAPLLAELHKFPAELFNLNTDLSERKNCYGEQPEVAAELAKILSQA